MVDIPVYKEKEKEMEKEKKVVKKETKKTERKHDNYEIVFNKETKKV